MESLSCAMAIGEELLISGAEVNRVEDTIRRICTAFGAERVDVFSITSSIIVTMQMPGEEPVTQTRRICCLEYDMVRLELLNQLSRRICSTEESLSISEIRNRLEEIHATPRCTFWQMMLGYALISASFSLFFGGDLQDATVSAAIGMMIKYLQRRVGNLDMTPIFRTFIYSFAGGLAANFAVRMGLGHSADMISIGNIMLLIPGFALTNGLRDMFSGDMITGLLRFTEALIVAVVIAFAFVLASFLLQV